MAENAVSFFELVADSSVFVGAFQKAKAQAVEFAGAFKASAASVSADAGKMGASLQRALATGALSRSQVNQMIAQRLQFYGGGAGSAVAGAEGAAGGLAIGGGLNSLLGSVALVTTLIAPLGLLAGGFLHAEASMASFASGVLRTSEAINMNAQDLQAWQKIGERTGLDAQSINLDFERFAKNLALGAPSLKQLGLNLKDLGITSTDVGRSILQLSDYFHTHNDAAAKAAIAAALFGRSGVELIPILNQGSKAFRDYRDELERMGVILSNSDLFIASKAQTAITQFGEAFEGAKNRLLAAALPGFTAFFQYLGALMENNGQLWNEIGTLISNDISFIIGLVSGLTGVNIDLTKSVKDAGAAYDGLAGTAGDAANGMNGSADAAAKATKAIDDQIAALQDQKRAQDAVYDAQKQALEDQLTQITDVTDTRRRQGEDIVSYERRLEELGIQDKIKAVDKAKSAYDRQVDAHIAALEKEKRAVADAGKSMGASLASGIGAGAKAGLKAGSEAATKLNQKFVEAGKGLAKWLQEFFSNPSKAMTDALDRFGKILGSAFVQGMKDQIGHDLTDWLKGSSADSNKAGVSPHKLPPGTAAGGYFSTPQVRLFAEAGPELLLPVSDRARSLALMEQSGMAALARSAGGGTGGGGITVIFNGPVADELVANRVLTKIEREMRKRGFSNSRGFGTG